MVDTGERRPSVPQNPETQSSTAVMRQYLFYLTAIRQYYCGRFVYIRVGMHGLTENPLTTLSILHPSSFISNANRGGRTPGRMQRKGWSEARRTSFTPAQGSSVVL